MGVNHATQDEETGSNSGLKLDQTVHKEQCDALTSIRAGRDSDAANDALNALRVAAAGGDNLMPHIFVAVKAECTVGEIMGALKEVFGTWMAPSGF